jgi:hypothetical protein
MSTNVSDGRRGELTGETYGFGLGMARRFFDRTTAHTRLYRSLSPSPDCHLDVMCQTIWNAANQILRPSDTCL